MSDDATVFVVDSDSLSRNAVNQLVRSMMLNCETYASGQEFLDAYHKSRHGCLVTEVRVPDVSGPQLQRRLAMDEAPLPVIFLTAHATVPIVVRTMQDGAVDFLEKQVSDQQLWESIQRALEIDRKRREALAAKHHVQQRLESLTRKEREVLELLADNHGTREIAEALGVSVRTIELRRSRIFKKLHIKSAAELIHFAIQAFDGHARHVFDLVPANGDGDGYAAGGMYR